jgi:hypothetical protein
MANDEVPAPDARQLFFCFSNDRPFRQLLLVVIATAVTLWAPLPKKLN